MNRRNFIKLASAFSFATALLHRDGLVQGPAHASSAGVAGDTANANAASTAIPGDNSVGETSVFSEEWLKEKARDLAGKKFELPPLELPKQLQELTAEQYRAIRYKDEANIWKDDGLAHQLQLLHTGFLYKVPVEMHLVENDVSRPVLYDPLQFKFDAPAFEPPADSRSGFSGFLARTPIHNANGMQEFLRFQGASYFHALASGQIYGASARGLSVNTAQAAGEEFPVFRAFWIRKPAPGEQRLIIYALLDGPSVAGAYKFTAIAGQPTTIHVDCTLFPRTPLSHVGIAPLTSMYFYGAADNTRMNDYRPAVHNSDCLSIWTGGGDWLLRPLINPDRLQYSAFSDRNPKGFGLVQRQRNFYAYQDIEARFGDRPSIWVEPQGEWGEGAVDLIELPSQSQIYDNIVAFWRPRHPLAEKAAHSFRYKLYWGWEPPIRSTKAQIVQTLTGGHENEFRQYVIDFVRGGSCADCKVEQLTPDIRTTEGEYSDVVLEENVALGGPRVRFTFRPQGAEQSDLRCELKHNGRSVSEVWVNRWTAI